MVFDIEINSSDPVDSTVWYQIEAVSQPFVAGNTQVTLFKNLTTFVYQTETENQWLWPHWFHQP